MLSRGRAYKIDIGNDILTLLGVLGSAPICSSRRASPSLFFKHAYISVVAPHFTGSRETSRSFIATTMLHLANIHCLGCQGEMDPVNGLIVQVQLCRWCAFQQQVAVRLFCSGSKGKT